ncbi:YcdB/YcdC domain-containing protein [Brevibacillus formosus]|uniref:YcdB/YcdC domain-containing protein n=1 Tax=Brevibacillus formosus TaxID=54913 RepID=UPI0018CE24C9|nr:YcdB/YcdC domain-containing protein [Brevibacillus formosus]MBG9941082.1 hypothetical protein [Brevibacillus formosus]
MKFPSDEEVLQEFRNRPDAVPRSEFLHTLEGKLVEVEQQHRSRSKTRRTTIRLGLSAAVLLAVFFLAPIFTRLITHPESIMTTKPEAPLVLKGQQLKLAEVSPAAKQTLEKLFNLVPELKTMEPKVIGKEDGVYEIVFYQKEQGKEQRYVSVEMVAATGKISNYENEKAMNEEAPSPTEEAKQMSAVFLQALLGDEFKQYQVNQTSGDDWDAVTYTRYANGLPVFSDQYVVGVNSNGVKYINTFEAAPLQISSESFAEPDSVLSEEELSEKVASFMELTYFAGSRNTGKPLLTYSLQTTGYVNAVTGEEIWGEASHKSRYSAPIPVTPGGKKVTVQTEEEVAKAVAEQFQVKLDEFILTGGDKKMKGEQMTTYKAKDGLGRVTVYSNSGVITGFQVRRSSKETASSIQHQNNPVNAQLSYDEAKEKAVQFLQPYLDSSVEELKVDQTEISMPSATAYSFTFYALHNGVIVADQNYLVNVDGQNGEIVNFMEYFTTPTEPFPELDTVISREDAAKRFLQSHPVELGYVLPVVGGKLQQKPLLVFTMDMISGFRLDAVTGEAFK